MAQSPVKKKSSAPMIGLIILIILAALVFVYLQKTDEPQAPVTRTAPVAPPVVEIPPENVPVPHYEPPAPPVVEESVPVEPLPELNASDEPLFAAIGNLGASGASEMVLGPEVLRKFVMAVNAVAEGKVVAEYRVVKSPPPPFVVEKYQVTVNGQTVDQERISAKNFTRYDAFTTVLSMLDTDAVVAMYKRHYPLLEEAYNELGLKKGNFHSVLIAAIDNILAAPEVEGDLLLIQPKVFYQFADPALEKLPQTHKLMIRMGPSNAATVKSSLRRLRVKLLMN